MKKSSNIIIVWSTGRSLNRDFRLYSIWNSGLFFFCGFFRVLQVGNLQLQKKKTFRNLSTQTIIKRISFYKENIEIDGIVVSVFMLAMLTTKNCRERKIKCTAPFPSIFGRFAFVFHVEKRNATYTYVSALFPHSSFRSFLLHLVLELLQRPCYLGLTHDFSQKQWRYDFLRR